MQNYNLYYSFMGVKFATRTKQRNTDFVTNRALRRMLGGKVRVQTLA